MQIRCFDVCYSTWFIKVGKSEKTVFTLTNTNTLLVSWEALKACSALTAQETAPELITTHSERQYSYSTLEDWIVVGNFDIFFIKGLK